MSANVPSGYKQTKVGVIPEDWDVVKLRNYLTESRESGSNGKIAKKLTVKLWGKGVFEKNEIREGSENTKYYKRRSGQLIYSKLDFLNCAFAIIPNELDEYESTLDLPCFKINGIDQYYLLSLIKEKRFYKRYGELANGGRKARRINPNDFLNFKIPFPSLKEQQKISKILITLDNVICKQEALIKSKEELKKGLIQKLLSGEVRFDGFDGEWGEVKFGEILNLTQSGLSRKLSSSDIGVVVIRSNNIKDNIIDIAALKYWYAIDPQGANLDNYFLEKDDILVNFINSLAQIGKMAIYRNELKKKVIFTTNILRVKFNKNVEIEFIKYVFQTKKYNNFILSIAKPAVNQASFTTKDFRKFKIKLPAQEEQQKIAHVLTIADKEIDLHKNELEALKEQKCGLMQRLLMGEVRVTV